jgi:glycosyltransferase involved in cell wall biosynthesis
VKIGIDISQLAYAQTGVANFLKNLVEHLIQTDKENQYVLFYSSLRRPLPSAIVPLQENKNVLIKQFKFPPAVLDILWNKLHVVPIEVFIGDVDIFITSDWTEPPARKAKKLTIVYDVIVYKYPEETAAKIVATQKRKLHWVKKESAKIFCISESTKEDVKKILGIEEERLEVVYPGIS